MSVFFGGLAIGAILGGAGMMFIMDGLIEGWIDRWLSASCRGDEMGHRASIAEAQIARIKAALDAEGTSS